MWQLNPKEGWATKNWCSQTLVLKKTLGCPLECKEIKPSILKEISPEYSSEGLMLKLKCQYFGHLMWRTDSLEKTLMLGKTEGRRRRGWQRLGWLDGITNWMEMSLSKLWVVCGGQGSLVCSVHGVAKSRTWLSEWITTKHYSKKLINHSWAIQLSPLSRNFIWFSWFLTTIFWIVTKVSDE